MIQKNIFSWTICLFLSYNLCLEAALFLNMTGKKMTLVLEDELGSEIQTILFQPGTQVRTPVIGEYRRLKATLSPDLTTLPITNKETIIETDPKVIKEKWVTLKKDELGDDIVIKKDTPLLDESLKDQELSIVFKKIGNKIIRVEQQKPLFIRTQIIELYPSLPQTVFTNDSIFIIKDLSAGYSIMTFDKRVGKYAITKKIAVKI